MRLSRCPGASSSGGPASWTSDPQRCECLLVIGFDDFDIHADHLFIPVFYPETFNDIFISVFYLENFNDIFDYLFGIIACQEILDGAKEE